MKKLINLAILPFLTLGLSKSSAQTVTGASVKEAVEQYVRHSVSSKVEAVVEFQNVGGDYRVGYKDCKLTVSSVNSVALKGLVTFLVNVMPLGKKDGYSQVIPITAKIRTFQNVLVTSQTIQPHTTVTPGEVTSVKTETTDYLNPVTELSELKGKWTSRWIQSGKALTFDMFDEEPVVKRGDDVTIICSTKNVIVREQGSAVQDGKLNQIINVTNEYRDNLRGRVVGKGEVVLVN